jgi:hypothetical protein
MYYWGNYEDSLYAYYKSAETPQDLQVYMDRLSQIISKGEQESRQVPPGIYAEYGFGLYKMKRYNEAIAYFEKEKTAWPEAVPLMDRMIKNVRVLSPDLQTTPAAIQPAPHEDNPPS